MAVEVQNWVWTLTCRRCARAVDLDDVCVPDRRLAEWATCCRQIMELESVLRSEARDAEEVALKALVE